MNAPANTTSLAAPPSLTMDAAASAKLAESLVMKGDISGLTPRERVQYYLHTCTELGLNPNAQPFAFLKLNGKEVMYPTRGATDQLARIHQVNREIIDGPRVMDLGGTKLLYAVCRATLRDGRIETATAAVPIPSGAEPIANAVMKVETKARRRATLAILGLALLDESEMDTIPASAKVDVPAPTREEVARAMDAAPTWADDLAACATLRDVRACWVRHAGTADHCGDAEPDDVRAWLSEHNIVATAAEVTAILATLPDAALVILDDIHADEEHETTVRIERVARRVARTRSTWDAHSADVTSKIVARSYAHATGTDLKAAGAALKRAIENGDPDGDEPPTGTDGPAREPGSDDGEDPAAAAYEAHRAAQGEARAQVTELRVVRDHTDEELITSEAAWVAYLATCNAFRTRHAFRNLTGAFVAEGVFVRREKAALARIEALGFRDPRGWLYAPPENQKKRRNEAA